jgi:predicted short-subunit dehydrogenase-like oxidoreductase (DUF2520 family)
MRHRPNKSSAPDSRPRERKPTVAIIGAGRLGTTLGKALVNAGYDVQNVVASTPAHTRRSAELISRDVMPVDAGSLHELRFNEVILITTPDREIGLVAHRLCESLRRFRGSGGLPKSRVVLHASGALTSAALAPLKEEGFAVGSMHPFVSISAPATDPNVFHGAFFCVEGDRRAVTVARKLAGKLGGQSFSLGSSDKPLYHAAGVMASGHVVALFDIAIEMLKDCGLSEQRARAVLIPLLQSTVTSLVSSTPAKALTGPFARGDLGTIKSHLETINAHELREVMAAYKLLGKRSLRLAAQRGMRAEDMLKKIGREIDSA